MAEPIANDWKAIHDRMQQIKAEESASHRPCPQCNDSGWMPDYMSARRGYMVCVCDVCHNHTLMITCDRLLYPRQELVIGLVCKLVSTAANMAS
jgi:hypothetical protein